MCEGYVERYLALAGPYSAPYKRTNMVIVGCRATAGGGEARRWARVQSGAPHASPVRCHGWLLSLGEGIGETWI